jgi:hypothetical protein
MKNNDTCCDSPTAALSRRGFLGLSLGGTLGLYMGGLGRVFAQDTTAARLAGFGAAKNCIILWMGGGASQIETFDPKPGHKNGGPTRAIDTRAKGVQIAHTLPRLAEQMQHVSLVRGMATKEGNHQRGRYFMHTGYVPSGTIQHPDFGSLICQQKADEDFDLPSYINLGGPAPGSGILGAAYAPFTIADARKQPANIHYAKDVDAGRFDRRRKLLGDLGAGFRTRRPGSETESHEAVVHKADKMMHSPRLEVFNLEGESKALRGEYGPSKFGQGCLLARRLVETGVKVVEVQLGGWDTHRDNFTKTTELCGQLDRGFATLVKDLAERDILSSTLVVCMGEFGRTPKINANEGRDHFARAWSLAMAGGGVKGGRVVGATSGDGMRVVERPTNAPDLVASIVHSMGLDPEYTNYSKEGRPLTVIDEGGAPVKKLFA